VVGIFSSRRRLRKNDSFASRVPGLRWLGPLGTALGIFFVVSYVFAGKFQFKSFDDFGAEAHSHDRGHSHSEPVVLSSAKPRSPETIRIATFNIKQFGQKKSGTRLVPDANVDVMGEIAKLVSQFDLVAIQEVRGSDGLPIRRLVDLLGESGAQYTATLSEPIGDEHYTESYAYVWDETRIRLIQNSAYVVHDDSKRMYREPMVASFETRVPFAEGRQPFRFTVINAHTDPDLVSPRDLANEINVLDDVFVRVRQYEYETAGEEDFLLVGDLNVNNAGLQELAQIPGMISVAGDQVTNTRRTKTYDHILLDSQTTREFTGQRGVVDLQSDLGLSLEQALLISDHMPVWAEFSAYEAPRVQTAAAPSTRMIR
jgi:endonuclease/exonuclease/phosphatase family metal-dependent hydrolase